MVWSCPVLLLLQVAVDTRVVVNSVLLAVVAATSGLERSSVQKVAYTGIHCGAEVQSQF
jgi:hypothetical protein